MRLVLSASDGETVVYLQGAHVAHFQPKGERPVLWMSAESRLRSRQADPRRGADLLPLVRAESRRARRAAARFRADPAVVDRRRPRESDGSLRATLDLTSDAAARGGFPHELALSLTVRVGRSLRLELAVRNTDTAPRAFKAALHSYSPVSDVRQVRLLGLEGTAFVDKTAAMARKPGDNGPVTIAAETDRVYLGAPGTVTIEDPGWRRRIVVGKSGSSTTVVWNPWIAKAKAMPDSATRNGAGWSASRRRTPWTTR